MARKALRKVSFIFLWYILYPNLLFLVFIPDIFEQMLFLVPLVIYYFFGALDTIARPFSQNEKIDKSCLILLLFFFLGPIFAILSYTEYKTITLKYLLFIDNEFLVLLGTAILVIGGIITVYSRITLGRFGTGIITLEPNHQLKTDGIFKFIRHPIYFGALLQGIGLYLSFRSIGMLIITTILFFGLFSSRANTEEIMLEQEFGDYYLKYKKKSKKFIPFLY